MNLIEVDKKFELQRIEIQNYIKEPEDLARWIRTAKTYVKRNPKLLNCTDDSLWAGLMESARVGLVPDGYESALIPYGRECSFLPMVHGITKKIYQHIRDVVLIADVVRKDDEFKKWTDDAGVHILHRINHHKIDSPVIGAFAMLTCKRGRFAEYVPEKDIENARKKGAKGSPAWRDWYDEMAKKVAIKRMAKRLPWKEAQAINDLIRDEEAFTVRGKNEPVQAEQVFEELIPPETIAKEIKEQIDENRNGTGEED